MSQMNPKHLISLLYNFYFIFRRRYLIILKKPIRKTYPPKSTKFERRLCAQTQDL